MRSSWWSTSLSKPCLAEQVAPAAAKEQHGSTQVLDFMPRGEWSDACWHRRGPAGSRTINPGARIQTGRSRAQIMDWLRGCTLSPSCWRSLFTWPLARQSGEKTGWGGAVDSHVYKLCKHRYTGVRIKSSRPRVVAPCSRSGGCYDLIWATLICLLAETVPRPGMLSPTLMVTNAD